MFLWDLLGLIIFIAIAFFPARIAASKGRSFLLWFLISIPFWWITVFVTLAMKDNTKANAKTEE